jgi:DnaK suppressor protein
VSLSKAQTTKFKKRLLAMRDELNAISDISADSRKPVELDQTAIGRVSRMDAIQGQAMQLETERRRGVERVRIDAALERIETGSFGYCTICDEDIAIKRLENDPSVPNCIDCQRYA